MFIPTLLFLLGLLFLIKGGDWFVDGATGIAHRFHLPEILIGATVVSIGTTLPEVMVSATSALSGHGEIAYGNAIGSIICNTSLIAAITIAVKPGAIQRHTLKTPVIFFFLSAAFYAGIAYTSGYFSRTIGLILLVIFLVYMAYTVLQMRTIPPSDESQEVTAQSQPPISKDLLLLVTGAVLSAIGANLFNLVLVSGVSAFLAPFHIPQSASIAGKNASLVLDIPVMLFVMAFMTLPALIRGKLSRFQGILLLIVYAVFCFIQFTMS